MATCVLIPCGCHTDIMPTSGCIVSNKYCVPIHPSTQGGWPTVYAFWLFMGLLPVGHHSNWAFGVEICIIICIVWGMRFIWHEPKRQANLKKHGEDFVDAERVFAGPTFTFADDREDYGEQRWVTLGLLGMKVIVIVHTETEDEIRVISMREADNDEQFLFFTNL